MFKLALLTVFISLVAPTVTIAEPPVQSSWNLPTGKTVTNELQPSLSYDSYQDVLGGKALQ